MIIQSETHDLTTKTGTMRTYVYRPVEAGKYPVLIFYSEIFQQTAPIARSASIMAGHGFIVMVPEVFHELNPAGTVLAYDDEGKDKGNNDKWTKPLEDHDSDTEALIAFASGLSDFNGSVGAMGVCIGGHLAYRAALNPNIKAASCLYATDIHSNSLPCRDGNDSFSRTKDIKAELQLVWGRQDPHVPDEGRRKIYDNLIAANTLFTWCEFNAQHAFMRDEGNRYDPALALEVYRMAVGFFCSNTKLN